MSPVSPDPATPCLGYPAIPPLHHSERWTDLGPLTAIINQRSQARHPRGLPAISDGGRVCESAAAVSIKETIIELCDCENVLLWEIGMPKITRKDVAQTYALALKSSECKARLIDWPKVNQAIVERWSLAGLKFIKDQAWSGKAFS